MGEYQKYLNRQNSGIPEPNREILDKGEDMKAWEVLPFKDKNKLLDDGYLPGENGFYHFKDGGAYAAALTKMPAVTIGMIDWWFWWHAKDSVRYKIWFPDMHFDISSDFGDAYHDETKSYRERLHLSRHFVTEDIGTGKEKIVIDFMSPEVFGFDAQKLRSAKETTLICARVGDLAKRVWHTKMCHAVRSTREGVEMRSRFWMAERIERMVKPGRKLINAVLNQPFLKRRLLPKELGKHMFSHCTQEYNNLKDILPEIYRLEAGV